MNLIARNPFDNGIVLERPYDDQSTVNELVMAARNAQLQWKEIDLSERRDRVLKAMEWFEKHSNEVAEDITRQMGKPIFFTLKTPYAPNRLTQCFAKRYVKLIDTTSCEHQRL